MWQMFYSRNKMNKIADKFIFTLKEEYCVTTIEECGEGQIPKAGGGCVDEDSFEGYMEQYGKFLPFPAEVIYAMWQKLKNKEVLILDHFLDDEIIDLITSFNVLNFKACLILSPSCDFLTFLDLATLSLSFSSCLTIKLELTIPIP